MDCFLYDIGPLSYPSFIFIVNIIGEDFHAQKIKTYSLLSSCRLIHIQIYFKLLIIANISQHHLKQMLQWPNRYSQSTLKQRHSSLMLSFYKKNNSFYQLATCRDLKGFRDGNGTKSSHQL